MSTNSQKEKRKTKMIRTREDLHKRLKFEAISQGITLSKLLDKIITDFLEKINENNYKKTTKKD
ncbi:MAG: toxin-antitoxin system HicB family antitoxin [Patescibacteria group bacterium]